MQQPTRRRFLAGTAATAGFLAGCSGPLGGGSGNTTPSGMTVDTLSVGGSTGDTVAVKPAGTATILDFFATWCAPCKPQMKELRTVHESFPDVHMLSLTWEEDTDLVKSFWTEYEGTWWVGIDDEARIAEEYGATRIPTKIVLDADGEEVWRHSGLAAADTIEKEVRAALGQS